MGKTVSPCQLLPWQQSPGAWPFSGSSEEAQGRSLVQGFLLPGETALVWQIQSPPHPCLQSPSPAQTPWRSGLPLQGPSVWRWSWGILLSPAQRFPLLLPPLHSFLMTPMSVLGSPDLLPGTVAGPIQPGAPRPASPTPAPGGIARWEVQWQEPPLFCFWPHPNWTRTHIHTHAHTHTADVQRNEEGTHTHTHTHPCRCPEKEGRDSEERWGGTSVFWETLMGREGRCRPGLKDAVAGSWLGRAWAVTGWRAVEAGCLLPFSMPLYPPPSPWNVVSGAVVEQWTRSLLDQDALSPHCPPEWSEKGSFLGTPFRLTGGLSRLVAAAFLRIQMNLEHRTLPSWAPAFSQPYSLLASWTLKRVQINPSFLRSGW